MVLSKRFVVWTILLATLLFSAYFTVDTNRSTSHSAACGQAWEQVWTDANTILRNTGRGSAYEATLTDLIRAYNAECPDHAITRTDYVLWLSGQTVYYRR